MSKTYRLAVASGVITDTLLPEADEAAEGPKGLMSRAELNARNRRLSHEMVAKVEARKERDRKEEEGKKKRGLGGWLSG
jgi:hypothetical protein